jgi:hypothetical protein
MEAASNHVFTGAGGIDTFLLTLSDVDVEADLLPAARDLDETHPALSDGSLLASSGVAAMLSALSIHVKRYGPGGITGLDSYLTYLNTPTPTLRAHGNFRKYLKQLSASNSFIQNDLEIATFACTGSSTGTYAHVAAIDTSNYAGAKLVVKNSGAVSTGATLTVTGKKTDGTTASLTATISTGTDATETDLSNTSKIFVDVTNITITGGTSTNNYKVMAKTDRDCTSA